MLRGPFDGVFAGVHLLPFYLPFDGADAGFDPVDHSVVDRRLGGWADVQDLAATHEVVGDVIVNHVSEDSAAARDWLARGNASSSAGMLLTFDAVYPDGVSEEELLRIHRPRPGLPFRVVPAGKGRRRLAWTTFTPQQLDLDVRHPEARRYISEILAVLAANGVSTVRLDAVGFAVKTPGTDSFMTAETLAFIEGLAGEARALGLEVLAEVHSSWRRNVEAAAYVDLVYDFALPPLVLHAITVGDGGPLRRWWEQRPRNAVTVLDTHDGIGVSDVREDPLASSGDLLSREQVVALADRIDANSGGTSVRASGATPDDLYQVDCTFYDALARDDRRYLLARALQLFTPGVPQVYYVGLLAGSNDVGLLERTGAGRELNRHRYAPAEISAALERPVVRAQLELIRWRGDPAFSGDWRVTGTERCPELRFDARGGHKACLVADLRDGDWEAVLRGPRGERRLSADRLG